MTAMPNGPRTRFRIGRPSGRRTSLAATYSGPSWAEAAARIGVARRTVRARTTRLRRHAPTIANDGGATRASPPQRQRGQGGGGEGGPPQGGPAGPHGGGRGGGGVGREGRHERRREREP